MVLFHSPHKSNRLTYVLDYLFTERLGIPYVLSESDSNIATPHKVCINYNHIPLENAWNFIPDGLLNTSEITPAKSSYLTHTPLQSPFSIKEFDAFSAIFFHLSRYEEYLTKKKDEHGRFHFSDSVIFQYKSLQIPFIDLWIEDFKNILIRDYQFKSEDFKSTKHQTIPTIDVDSVFAYQGKPWYRQVPALVSDCLHFRFHELQYRLKVLLAGASDPNNNFDVQLSALQHLKATYFIQCGPYGRYDKNVAISNRAFQAVLHKIKNAGHQIGLHPSYGSDSKAPAIKKEKKALETVIQSPITLSRQHFLKMHLPQTYRALQQCGITKDYSMGYSHVNGFRAGTAHPFQWFDLEKDQVTPLTLQPFCCMDVAYKQFLKMSVDECITDSDMIRQQLKALNAPFVFVFHNESLSGHRGWENWDKVFNHWINE